MYYTKLDILPKCKLKIYHWFFILFLFCSILQSNGVKIESSAINGEPQAVEYTNEPAAKHIPLFDARNVILRGCYCTEGEAFGLVIRTGKYTVFWIWLFFNYTFRCWEILHIFNQLLK